MPRRFPSPGDPAPEFELPGTRGPFALSDHRGERVILLFYPADGTPVCTRQFCSYRDAASAFAELDVVAVGISPQGVPSHERFIAEHGLTLTLLADVDQAVARRYGVHSRIVGTRRASFVVDAAGIVRYRHDNPLSLGFDTVDDLRRVLASL